MRDAAPEVPSSQRPAQGVQDVLRRNRKDMYNGYVVR